MKKLTSAEFIERAKKIHPEFEYKKTNYINMRNSIIVTCPVHGDIEVIPSWFLNQKIGCSRCAGLHKYSTEEFIKKCKTVHGNKYNYDNVNYTNQRKKVCITCFIHGNFLTSPDSFLRGHGCPKCTNPNAHLTKTEFIQKSKKIHGEKYDYSKTEIKSLRDKATITCLAHGDFIQVAQSHLMGHEGCPQCRKNKMTHEKFITKAKLIHKNKYDYSKTNYINYKTKVCIICPKHGEFFQKPNCHLTGNGCPLCSGNKNIKWGLSWKDAFQDENGIWYFIITFPDGTKDILNLEQIEKYVEENNLADSRHEEKHK